MRQIPQAYNSRINSLDRDRDLLTLGPTTEHRMDVMFFTPIRCFARRLPFLALLAEGSLAFCQEGTVTGTVVDTSGASIAKA